jgi:hypothetical protein
LSRCEEENLWGNEIVGIGSLNFEELSSMKVMVEERVHF